MNEFLLLTLPDTFLPDPHSSFVVISTDGEIYIRDKGVYYPVRITEDGKFDFSASLDVNSNLIQKFLFWAFKTTFLLKR